MSDNLDIDGTWKGEYAYDDKFIVRIKTTLDTGLFTGICQDDPIASKVDLTAAIYGAVKNYELFFVKKYPKTLIQDIAGL